MTNIAQDALQVPCLKPFKTAQILPVVATRNTTCFARTSRNQGGHYNTSSQRWTCPKTTGVWLTPMPIFAWAHRARFVFSGREFTVNGSGTNAVSARVAAAANYDGGGGYDHPSAAGQAP